MHVDLCFLFLRRSLENVDICLSNTLLQVEANLSRGFTDESSVRERYTESISHERVTLQLFLLLRTIYLTVEADNTLPPRNVPLRDEIGKLRMGRAREELDGVEVARRHLVC